MPSSRLSEDVDMPVSREYNVFKPRSGKKSVFRSLQSLVGRGQDDPLHKLADMYEQLQPSQILTDVPYLSAVASVLFAAVFTRLDVALVISFLSRFSMRPFAEAWEQLTLLMIYLYRTRKVGLKYKGRGVQLPACPSAKPPLNPKVFKQLLGLIVFSDASWKNNSSYAGFFVMLSGAAVDWGAVLLKVMCSSAEAEIASGSLASKRVIYIRSFLGEIMAMPQLPVSHIIDNSALPSLTENLGSSKKTEHFRRWQLIMRYMVTHGYTYVHLCKTADMLADPMAGTPKDYIQFLNFRRYVTGMS